MTARSLRGLAALGAVAALSVGLVACSSSASPAASSGATAAGGSGGVAASDVADVSGSLAPKAANGVSQVKITMTGNSCTIDHPAAAAGPVTFTVDNVSAPAITEVELQQDQRIIGEKENLAPGLPPVSLTLTLTGGTYVVYCPGADTENQNFTVTGTAAQTGDTSTQALLQQGITEYAQYVSNTVAAMVVAVGNLDDAIQSGNVSQAKEMYALARPFYEKIESDVDGFVLPGFSPDDNAGNLDYLIDMRADNLDPKVGWHGFHAIERDLFSGDGAITATTKKMSTELVTNVGKLAGLAKGLTYKPEDLANGAAGLLEEVQTSKITGSEEAFSHLDLIDFAANVEGAQQAFADLKPGLTKIDPTLTQTVADQFTVVEKALDKYRDPAQSGGYVLWTAALRQSDAASLSKTVQALQDPLAQIAEKVATA